MLYDILLPPEKYPLDRGITLTNPNNDKIIALIIEFSLVYAELFKYSIKPESLLFKEAVNDDKKKRAIKAMMISEIDKEGKIGFLPALFKDDFELSH